MAKRAPRKGQSLAPPRAHTMPRTLAILLLATAVVAAVTSLYLTYVHYRAHHEPGWQSACAVSDAINCDAVVRSQFGALAGVPLSLVGLWFYAITGALAASDLLGNPARFPRSPAAVLLLGSAVAVALSVALAIIAAVHVGAFCLFCGLLYAANLLLFLVSRRALASTSEALGPALAAEWNSWKERPSYPATAGATALVTLLVTGVLYASSATPSLLCQAAVDATRRDAPPRPVDLVIYADFQCPACKALDRATRSLQQGPRLQLRHGHFPLDAECNPHITRTHHTAACRQARAALCAEEQPQGERYRHKLFDQGPVTEADLVALARSAELDAPAFEACLGSDRARAALAESIETAARAGVHATPTTLVNGQPRVGLWTVDDLQCLRAIDPASDSALVNTD